MNRNFEFGKFDTMPLTYNVDRSIPPRYEKCANGDVDYVCTVDVDSFSPSDIRITQNGTLLTIEAKRSNSGKKHGVHGTSEESEYKEFKKEISLPNNIDMKKELRTTYNENHLLEIRVPTLPQSYSTLYPPNRRPISIYKNSPHVNFNVSTPQLSAPVYSSSVNTNCIGQRPFNGTLNSFNGSMGNLRSSLRSPIQFSERPKLYSEEIVIDPIYKPEDLIVRTKGTRVIIHAKHEEVGLNGFGSVKEFSDEHDLPSHVDPDQLKATLLGNGILLIEAPYKQPGYMKTSIAVHRDLEN